MIRRGLRLALGLWSLLAFLGIAAAQLNAETKVDARFAEARDLFLANRLTEALAALDEQTLARSGKANLLAGLIHLYRARIDYEEAKSHLERAGALGIAHAYAMAGNLTYDERCAECPAQAISFYQGALELRDDPAARFGIALALDEQGRRTESLQAFEELLSERTPQFWRAWAASFAGTILLKRDPARAEQLLLMAASADMPEAQAILGIVLLQAGREAEGEVWLTRAVAHRSEIAMDWHRTLDPERQSDVTRNSVAYLLERSRSQDDTDFGRGAVWCARSGRMDLFCLPHALTHHRDCDLSDYSRELLSVTHFEGSAVYRSCRSREMYGRPLLDKPSAWPRVRE